MVCEERLAAVWVADIGAGVDRIVHVGSDETVGLRNARPMTDEIHTEYTRVNVDVDVLPHNVDESNSPSEEVMHSQSHNTSDT